MGSRKRRKVHLHVEVMERRELLAGQVSNGVLTVSSDEANPIAITVQGGNVRVNNADPDTGAVAASSITGIVINGNAQDNVINLAGVSLTDFTALITLQASTGDGNDTIIVSTAGIPAGLTVDLGAGTSDRVVLTGSATNLSLVFPNPITWNVDGRAFTSRDVEHPLINFAPTNLSFTLPPGSVASINDGAAANDGISRITNVLNPNIFTEFVGPTGALTFSARPDSAATFDFAGLDAASRPASVALIGGAQDDTAIVSTAGIPENGLTINGGAGRDTLRVIGTDTRPNIRRQRGGTIVRFRNRRILIPLGDVETLERQVVVRVRLPIRRSSSSSAASSTSRGG